jgi:V8-like Glu-specific endopeptidase
MAGDSISTFPGNSVVLIESPNPDGDGYLQGSGVVIGPHTILTASHVVFDTSDQTPVQNIKLYPGWDSTDPAQGPGYIPTTDTDHYNPIGTFGSDDVTRAQSASDFAIIDTSYTFSSWMGVLLNYAGGVVTATGYPAIAGGLQTDRVGTVSADPSFSVLDYGTLSTSAGNSGGPLWLDFNGSDDVAGIVSTGLWATQLTSADWTQIESWVSQDGYSLATNLAPVVTAVPNASLVVGQSISASSLIASISNPSGDDITNDIYEDLGGGSGYFTVNGVRQADGVWISAALSENVQYVAGASPGSDTLGVGIYDATTNSNISASVIATTIHAAPVVTAVPNVSLAEGQSISASSLFASISNPSGDDILEDIYEDFGGGSGYFTVDGLKYPDSIPIYATPSTEVQYVGGSSPSSDTLSVGIYDLTTNSYIYAPNSVVATTIQAEGNASDILWQNANGQASIWAMNGNTRIGGGPLSPNPGRVGAR